MKSVNVPGGNRISSLRQKEFLTLVNVGESDFEYRLRFSKQTGRIRISVLPGRVSVTAPPGISERTVDAFVRSKSSWILDKLALFEKHPGPSSEFRNTPGEEIWLFGEKHSIRCDSTGNSFAAADGELLLGDEWFRGNRLRTLLDDLLMERVQQTAGEFRGIAGLEPSRIRLGNARSRWGSCSPAGTIMINRKLVHAPVNIIDYITLHELMHLRHRNHSSLFWKDLVSVFPGTAEARKWLRYQGAHLL